MKTTKRIFAALAVGVVILSAACKKDTNPSGFMAAQMTEARTPTSPPPANSGVTAVYIDVSSVEVHYANEKEGTAGWVTLNTKAGIYDLFKLQHDVTAVIASDTKIPVGEISQIRLILGPNNSIFIGGDGGHALTVPSGDTSGLKINVHSTIGDGEHWVITLAFDADKSIVLEGNGDYKLKPVIEVKSVLKY